MAIISGSQVSLKQANTWSGNQTAPAWVASGLTGAVQASRYVGATTSGAPVAGTFAVGDFIIAENGHIFVCTTAGSPGTWTDVGGSGAPVSSVFTRTGAVVAAANDYSYSQIANSAAAIAISNLADPTTGKVIGSAANAAASVFPPGYEIAYTEFTSSVSISATTEGTANTVVSAGAITFDGTAVYVEFYSPLVEPGATAGSSITLYILLDGTSQGLAWFAAKDNTATLDRGEAGCFLKRKFTPSAASHTFLVAASRGTANGTVVAGLGGTGNYMPGYIRISKA